MSWKGWSEWRSARQSRRRAREVLYHASHVRGMREDIAPAGVLSKLLAAELHLRRAMKDGNSAAMEAGIEPLEAAAHEMAPPRAYARWRERLETIVVAAAVAMSVRTYFVQPFKIPTGSMQPTLNGIRVYEQKERRVMDYPPLSYVGWALFGEGYVEVKARRAGYISSYGRAVEDGTEVFIEGVGHRIRRGMELRVLPGAAIARGDVLASGRVSMGDHIFVNKIRYNFLRPRRGEVFVFDTSRVHHPIIRNDSFYIKRLVGLPGEKIRIDPPYLTVNGSRVVEPAAFRRMVENPEYHGYIFGDVQNGRKPVLGSATDALSLGARDYLPMGDNTRSSLDGRYFGAVPADSIVGPAFWVYWPFTRHWGPIL